jgi:hypothetical protein
MPLSKGDREKKVSGGVANGSLIDVCEHHGARDTLAEQELRPQGKIIAQQYLGNG